MSDNRTTELRISEPLRGFIRHQSNRAYIDGGQVRWLTDIADKIDAKHEQAIAATLGRRDCKLRDCEGSFSAVNRPVWLCDCGAFMTQYTDATTYHKPNYCPNCGARVERSCDDRDR